MSNYKEDKLRYKIMNEFNDDHLVKIWWRRGLDTLPLTELEDLLWIEKPEK